MHAARAAVRTASEGAHAPPAAERAALPAAALCAPYRLGRDTRSSNLRIARALCRDAAAGGFVDEAIFGEELLAVRHPAVDLVGRLASQQQGGARHVRGR